MLWYGGIQNVWLVTAFPSKLRSQYFNLAFANMKPTKKRLPIPVNSTCISLKLSEQNTCFGCSECRSLSTFCKRSTKHRSKRTQCKKQWETKACQVKKGVKALRVLPKARKFYLSTWNELDEKEYQLSCEFLKLRLKEKKKKKIPLQKSRRLRSTNRNCL